MSLRFFGRLSLGPGLRSAACAQQRAAAALRPADAILGRAKLRLTHPPSMGMAAAGVRGYAAEGHGESYEDFKDRYVKFFEGVEDLFELQRGLNNCFAHDLVPPSEVLVEALKAARRVNDFATAVRIFEGGECA